MMWLRNKLEELGKMNGIARDEKGIISLLTHQQEAQILCYLQIENFLPTFQLNALQKTIAVHY